MKMTIYANGLELTDAIRDYAEKKLGELDKFIPKGTLSDINVELQKTTSHHKKGEVFRAEANVKLPGKLIRGESQEDNLYAAIDLLKDELKRDLRKYKDRHHDLQIRGGRSLKKRLSLSRLAWRKKDINDKNL